MRNRNVQLVQSLTILFLCGTLGNRCISNGCLQFSFHIGVSLQRFKQSLGLIHCLQVSTSQRAHLDRIECNGSRWLEPYRAGFSHREGGLGYLRPCGFSARLEFCIGETAEAYPRPPVGRTILNGDFSTGIHVFNSQVAVGIRPLQLGPVFIQIHLNTGLFFIYATQSQAAQLGNVEITQIGFAG